MVFVTLDKAGRMVLPKLLREEFNTDVFDVVKRDHEIVLKPKTGLLGLFGKFPKLDVENFKKEHAEEWRNEHFA